MPIEIQELVIRVTVTESNPGEGGDSQHGVHSEQHDLQLMEQRIRTQVLAQCQDEIRHQLQRLRGR